MNSTVNSYDNNKYVNGVPISLPFKGVYEDLNGYFGLVISCFSTKNDTLYVDFLNTLQNSTSELDVSGIIRETYNIIPNENNLFIIEPKLRYFRIKIVTSSYSITDIRKVNTYLIDNGIPFTKIYGSERVPIKTDASGNLQVGVISGITVDISGITFNLDSTNTLITQTNQILTDLSGTQHNDFNTLHTDISGSNTLLNTVNTNLNTLHTDISGSNTLLNILHTDISGSNTLLNSVNSNLNTLHTDISGSNTLLNTVNTNLNTLHTDISGSNTLLNTVNTNLNTLHTDISGSNTLLNTLHTDISGSNTLLNILHTDISGSNTLLNRFNFDVSNNLQMVENLNFITNTALYGSRYQYVNIIGNSGGLTEGGINGTRDLVDGTTAVVYNFPLIPHRITLVSTSILDISTYKIKIVGLDSSYNQITEDISLNGTSVVTSVKAYLRLNSLYVVQSDTTYMTSFTNALNGKVTINDPSGNVYGTIDVLSGIRLAAVYTVPAGYKLIITNLNMSDQTATTCTLFIYSRQNDGVTQNFILSGVYYYNNGQRDINISNCPLIFNAKADILCRITTGNNGKAFCNIGAMLCKL